jgi:hypothetical protein
MEIRFCSVCNESIPDGEFDAGRAIVSGKTSQHVACALRRSVATSGTRSWLTFLLALGAAGVSTFLLVARLADEGKPPVIRTVPDVVARHVEDVARDTEDRLTALQDRGRVGLRDDLAASLDKRIQEALEAVRAAVDRQDERLRETGSQVHDRLTGLDARLVKVQQQMAGLVDWKVRIAQEAEQLRRDLEAVGKREVPAPPVTAPAPAAQEPAPPPPDPDREKEIDRWIERLEDSDADIVFSATIELARLKALRAATALVRVLDRHKDFYARLGAATALGEIEAADAVANLIEALEDKDDLVRTAASEALHRITGQDFNFVSGLTKNERIRIQKRWRQWWKDNEADVRARLGQERGDAPK